MLKNVLKYLKDLRSNTIKLEREDINGKPNSFIGTHSARILCGIISILIIIKLDGFNTEFITYCSTVLSILIGLFLTSLIFGLDRFYTRPKNSENAYKIALAKDYLNAKERNYSVSVKHIDEKNSREGLWDKQSYNFLKQFSYVTGYNIVLSIFTLILLSFNTLFPDVTDIQVYHYYFDFDNISLESIGKLLFVISILLHRFFIIYFIGRIVYNTLFVVASMIHFINEKLKIEK
jgi:hypothetical protein